MPGAELRLEGNTLVLTGTADFETVPELIERLGEIAGRSLESIDAAGLDRVDSAGLAFLIWCKKTFAPESDAIALKGAPEKLSRLLDVTGLRHLFRMDE